MPGTRTNQFPVADVIHAFQAAALSGAVLFTRWVAPFSGRILAVKANAGAAGSGGVNSVLDVQINGVSAYTTTANRPTLVATSAGEFQNTNPDVRAFRAGDVISLHLLSATTGQTNTCFDVAVGLPS